jgi:lipopolysaccharide transport system ATP-binding protein
VILVSHGMKSVREICNRCIYLKDGRVAMDGTPEDVTKAYIDEVRGEDDAALMIRFAAHVGNRSLTPGYAIENTAMTSGELRQHTVRIEAQKRLSIQIEAVCLPENLSAICRVCIMRLDGIMFFQEDFSAADYFSAGGRVSLEVEFSPLSLAPAVYRLDIELRESTEDNASLFAQSSSIFEVYSLSPPTGGKPMLYYPVCGTAKLN